MDVALDATESRAVLVSRLLLGEHPNDGDQLAADLRRRTAPLTPPARREARGPDGRPPGPPDSRGRLPKGTLLEMSTSERIGFELSVTRTDRIGAAPPDRMVIDLHDESLVAVDRDGDGLLTPADVVWPRLKIYRGS